MNENFFSVTIKSNYTHHELKILLGEVLNAIEKQHMQMLTNGHEIWNDLHFTIQAAADDRSTLPKLLLGAGDTVDEAKSRLMLVLCKEFYPSLHSDTCQGDSQTVVVRKSVLTDYFIYHIDKARSGSKQI